MKNPFPVVSESVISFNRGPDGTPIEKTGAQINTERKAMFEKCMAFINKEPETPFEELARRGLILALHNYGEILRIGRVHIEHFTDECGSLSIVFLAAPDQMAWTPWDEDLLELSLDTGVIAQGKLESVQIALEILQKRMILDDMAEIGG